MSNTSVLPVHINKNRAWILFLLPGLFPALSIAQAEPLYLNFTRPPITSITELAYDSSKIRSPFAITLNFSGDLTASQRTVFNQAKAAWESRLSGYQSGISITGVSIDASSLYIDGEYGILGRAGPTKGGTQGGYTVPTEGIMEFDSADMSRMETNGTLKDVIEHEMGHVLGIGTLWGHNSAYTDGSFKYTGDRGLTKWKQEFQASDTFVPVESEGGAGTAEGHWDEIAGGAGLTDITDSAGRDMRDELMTGWLSQNTFFSDTTLHSMQDLGYAINETPPVTRTLTVNKVTNNNSDGSILGPGINCGLDCIEQYADNSTITLEAYGSEDSRFISWSGGNCLRDESCILTMNAGANITANFDIRSLPLIMCTPTTPPIPPNKDYSVDTFLASNDKIITSGSVRILKRVHVTFESRNGINLAPGFKVQRYAQFRATTKENPCMTF